MKWYFYGDVVPNFSKPIEINWANFDGDEIHFINLEAPVSATVNPIKKAGPHLSGNREALREIGLVFPNSIISVANNHAWDYGKTGLDETITLIPKSTHTIIGYESDLNEQQAAYQLTIINLNGKKIGLLAASENQFGIKRLGNSGINGFFPELFSAIVEAKSQVDKLVISFHAGAELIPFPSPYLTELYRSFISIGADIVWGHHPHVPQYRELYKNGCIIYGNGNSIMQPKEGLHQQNSSLVTVWDSDSNEWKDIGTRIREEKNQIVWFEDEQVLNECQTVQKLCQSKNQHEALWQEHSISMYQTVYEPWLKKNYAPQEIKNWYGKKVNQKKPNTALLYHLFSCFSHSQAIETALGIQCGEFPDLRTAETAKIFESIKKKVNQ